MDKTKESPKHETHWDDLDQPIVFISNTSFCSYGASLVANP